MTKIQVVATTRALPLLQLQVVARAHTPLPLAQPRVHRPQQPTTTKNVDRLAVPDVIHLQVQPATPHGRANMPHPNRVAWRVATNRATDTRMARIHHVAPTPTSSYTDNSKRTNERSDGTLPLTHRHQVPTQPLRRMSLSTTRPNTESATTAMATTPSRRAQP